MNLFNFGCMSVTCIICFLSCMELTAAIPMEPLLLVNELVRIRYLRYSPVFLFEKALNLDDL
jgi:hypothetical protein